MPGEVNEGAMSGNVLQTRTPAWLLLTVLLIAGVTTTARHRVGAGNAERLFESAERVEYCAAPARAVTRRRAEVGHRADSRNTTAMLLVLLAQGARRGGLSR
jgi:hypothetical protein